MTIVVAAAAPDGIVLASDSRTTYVHGRRHRIASDHAAKVFAPYSGVGVATFGIALIQGQTISGLMEEYVAQRSDRAGTAVEDVAEDLSIFFQHALERAVAGGSPDPPPGALGFLVAGYDAAGAGRIVEVLLPSPAGVSPLIKHDVSTREDGVVFRGRTRYMRRMLEGYDTDALAAQAKLPAKAKYELQRLGYIIGDLVTTQDALDLATFIVRMTIDMERVTDGTYAQPGDIPVCGGAMQALLVSRSRSEWIAREPLRVGPAGLA